MIHGLPVLVLQAIPIIGGLPGPMATKPLVQLTPYPADGWNNVGRVATPPGMVSSFAGCDMPQAKECYDRG